MTGLEINPMVALMVFIGVLFGGGLLIALCLKYSISIILNEVEAVRIKTTEPIERGYINIK